MIFFFLIDILLSTDLDPDFLLNPDPQHCFNAVNILSLQDILNLYKLGLTGRSFSFSVWLKTGIFMLS